MSRLRAVFSWAVQQNNPMQCGAKTRSGEPCKTPAMPNGRCRMHGGKSPGAARANQNAKTHGIYSRVLTEEEKELWEQVELGKVDDELRICKLRLMRAIRAETESNGQPEIDARTEKPLVIGGVPVLDEPAIEERSYKRRDYAGIIDKLMARIESLEKTRADLLGNGGADGGPVSRIEIEVVRGKDA